MANQGIDENFRKRMEGEDTSYLSRILAIHNTGEWSEEKLAIIADILRARGEIVPNPISSLPRPSGRQSRAAAGCSFGSFINLLQVIGLIALIFTAYGIFDLLVYESIYLRLLSNGRTVSTRIANQEVYLPGSDYEFSSTSAQYSFLADVNGEMVRFSSSKKVPDSISLFITANQPIEVVYDVSNPNTSAVNWGPLILKGIIIFGLITIACFGIPAIRPIWDRFS